MIAIIYFALAGLYTLACIADGPDIKPKLKVKVSNYLRTKADKLHPFRYCDYFTCLAVPSNKVAIENNFGKLHKVEECIKFTEYDRFEATKKAINIYDVGKKLAVNKLLVSCIPYIKFDMIDNHFDNSVYVRATLLIGEINNNNYELYVNRTKQETIRTWFKS